MLRFHLLITKTVCLHNEVDLLRRHISAQAQDVISTLMSQPLLGKRHAQWDYKETRINVGDDSQSPF